MSKNEGWLRVHVQCGSRIPGSSDGWLHFDNGEPHGKTCPRFVTAGDGTVGRVRSRNIPVQTLAAALMVLAVPFGSAGLTTAIGPTLTPVPGPEPFCSNRLMLLATETLIAAGSTECLHELEVEMNAAASTNATWLYGTTPETACTLLWWQSGSELLFFAAPCYKRGRSADSSSDLPCQSLPLVGQARRDVCGPGDLTQPQVQQASQANILECLGPITALQSSSEAEASPVEDCLNELLNDPTVGNVVECINQILGPVDNDAAQANRITCPSVDELCPAPILDLDAMSACGVPICNRDCSIPEPCTGENQIGIKPDCQTIQACSGDEVGVEPYCVNPPNVQFCNAPGTGIIVNDFEACVTVTLCPSPQFGIKVNGIGYCQNPVNLCNPPEIGVQPTCIDPNDYVCDDAEIGLRPLCIAQPALCDPPEYGVEPTCVDPADYECDDGEVGVQPACRKLCTAPEVGVEPNCKDPNSLMCDEADEVGLKPVCIDPDDYVCPTATIGVPPACFDGLSVLMEVIGIVLDVIGGIVSDECGVGTMPYQDNFGQAWCASPAEISEDAYWNSNSRFIHTEIGNTDAVVDAETDIEGIERAEFTLADLEMTEVASTDACNGTCNVVFVRGYTAMSSGSGGGDYGYDSRWDDPVEKFESWGYTVDLVEIYGHCRGDSDASSHGSHDTWHAGHHVSSDCASGTGHDEDTKIQHLAYHLAWYISDTYGTNPVDLVSWSMGGLLIRYMVEKEGKHPGTWPVLNIEDAVTIFAPHGGVASAAFGTTQGDQMNYGSGFMDWLKDNAQNPQGMVATDWTAFGADEDNAVNEKTALDMEAAHKIRYNKNTGGWANCSYDHDEWFYATSDAENCEYYWWLAGDGKGRMHSTSGPHIVKRIIWSTWSAGH